MVLVKPKILANCMTYEIANSMYSLTPLEKKQDKKQVNRKKKN